MSDYSELINRLRNSQDELEWYAANAIETLRERLEQAERERDEWAEKAMMLPLSPTDNTPTVAEAAKVLLGVDEKGNRTAVYNACENRVKVYKFDAVLRALAAQKGGE